MNKIWEWQYDVIINKNNMTEIKDIFAWIKETYKDKWLTFQEENDLLRSVISDYKLNK